jgi:hypothetical protein
MRAWALALIAVMAIASGCIVDSKRQTISYTVQPDSLIVASSTFPVVPCHVDLNEVAAYRQLAPKIRGLTDVALLGTVKNTLATNCRLEWWITPDSTSFTTAQQVRAAGSLLWVGSDVPAKTTLVLDWNKSAGHTDQLTFGALLRELNGDGAFTLYALGSDTGSSFRFTMLGPVLVLIVDTGS